MASEKLYSLIDRYLTNQMSEEERVSFEARVRDEPELADEVRLHVRAEYVARKYGHEVRKATFNQEFDRLSTDGKGGIIRPFNRGLLGSVAAAVVVLIGLAFMFWPKNTSSLDLDTLYAQEINNQVMSVRRGVEDTSLIRQTWLEASTQFNRAGYPQAIGLLEKVLADSAFTSKAKAQLYLGLSHLMLSNSPDSVSQGGALHLEAAIQAFRKVPGESSYIENALWFTALAYAKSGNTSQTISALEEVVRYPDHYKKEVADALLERLREDR